MTATQLPQVTTEVRCNALPERWNVLKTFDSYSFRLRDALQSFGVPTYHPVYSYYRQTQYYQGDRVRSLFPGYLFAGHIDPDVALRLARLLPVKAKFHNVGTVDNAILDVIRERENEAGYIRLFDDLVSGDVVEVVDGVFTGIVTEVRKVLLANATDGTRVTVLLSLLGRPKEITLERKQVRRVVEV